MHRSKQRGKLTKAGGANQPGELRHMSVGDLPAKPGRCFRSQPLRKPQRPSSILYSIALLAISGFVTSHVVASQQLPILTTAHQAHSLSNKEAERGYPVHLRGVVTYFDPDYGTGFAAIFVHDSTGSIFVKPRSDSIQPIPAGTVIDVRGLSGPGGFGPIVTEPHLQGIGHAPLPANPPKRSLPQLETGSEDAQWIQVEGTVHAVLQYSHSVTLRLAMEGGTVSVALLREPGEPYAPLVDAKVRIRANAAPTINGNGQMIGVHLMAPNLSAVTVVDPPPGDPFQRPPMPINGLLHWDQLAASHHRVHLRGKVTLNWPGSSLCIQDATRGICVQTDQDTPLAAGDLVDVAGFAATENSSPVITDAVFKKAGESEPIPAHPISAEDALIGTYDSQPIRIDGELIGYDHASADTTLLLSSGKTLFTAILPQGVAGSESSPWGIGSKLRVTGICSVHLDAQGNVREGVAVTKSFRVLLRSPGDVTILHRPSWWTPTHALILLAAVLTGTLAILIWVVVLRRRLQQQANLLRKSEESFRHMALHDSLTGLATRVVLQDRLLSALESAKRHQQGLALLMLDLDRFKDINDTFGHHAGYEVLRVTATRLQAAVRASDTVVRMGGDEFIVLLPELRDPNVAEMIAAGIVESLSSPVAFAGRQVPITASVGIVTAFGDELDADSLLRYADAALYSAKARGRACFQRFTPDLVRPPVQPQPGEPHQQQASATTKCA